eukprot:SAG31_NODE_4470_length_3205_cov_70.394915_1_plen_97_part_00
MCPHEVARYIHNPLLQLQDCLAGAGGAGVLRLCRPKMLRGAVRTANILYRIIEPLKRSIQTNRELCAHTHTFECPASCTGMILVSMCTELSTLHTP